MSITHQNSNLFRVQPTLRNRFYTSLYLDFLIRVWLDVNIMARKSDKKQRRGRGGAGQNRAESEAYLKKNGSKPGVTEACIQYCTVEGSPGKDARSLLRRAFPRGETGNRITPLGSLQLTDRDLCQETPDGH